MLDGWLVPARHELDDRSPLGRALIRRPPAAGYDVGLLAQPQSQLAAGFGTLLATTSATTAAAPPPAPSRPVVLARLVRLATITIVGL